ncbi:hypothetical protein NQ314_002597 [Rhamnusium bicolor]|uniref:ZAD domain-containing protein n=1 Tax=Rhamnusium bicolor TaxID=1586634 RepID=A0AAV8ZRK5_9CUCU|nr:hypothetical protein NQ314_002597 [Rhamnusium bicolor]
MEDNCDKSENDVTVKREIGYEDIMEVDNFELNVNSEEIKVKSELTNSERSCSLVPHMFIFMCFGVLVVDKIKIYSNMSDGNMICKLCLKTICDNNFDIIEEITKQMLNALLLNVNMDEGVQGVMCLGCATKLQNAIDFKTACLNTKNKVMPFNASEENVKQNNLKENRILELIDKRICRFCLNVLESGCYTCLQKKEEYVFIVDMVQKYIPELRLCVNEELVTCEACLVSLQELLSFITGYLGAEVKKEVNIGEPENAGQPKFNDNEGFTLEDKVVCSNVDETKLQDNYIKTEDITVKDEIKYEDTMEVDNFKLNVNNEEINIKSESTNSER